MCFVSHYHVARFQELEKSSLFCLEGSLRLASRVISQILIARTDFSFQVAYFCFSEKTVDFFTFLYCFYEVFFIHYVLPNERTYATELYIS